jgi:uncharacterized protein
METFEGNHPHGAMRRKDREITDRAEMDDIILASKVMHLALADNNVPFIVPVYFEYDGTALYFHSARKGSKIEILKRNNLVCFEISIEQGIIPADKACDFEAKHRTVIGVGRTSFVEDLEAKRQILQRIVARFTDQKFDLPDANVNAAAVVRIEIESLKGKKHGF